MRRRLHPGRQRVLALAARLAFAICVMSMIGPVAVRAANPEATNPEIGGPFTLVDQSGRTVTDAQFRGQWMLVYFGYTHCPDACPTALSDMAAALSDLDPAKRAKVRAIFISVDPERDTPAVMKDYVEAFDSPNIVGLTGTVKQVNATEAVYRVRAQRYGRKDGDYTMSHSSTIHIMDPAGHFVALVRPEQIAERLAQIVP
jgi:cytochrome oxidase Cu insertion factor (SCO1/SenC/PrrC family)